MGSLLIPQIVIGERRREDLGDIEELAASIRKYGLLHPIVVDDDGNLVAGERRLHACESLGWTEVETRSLGELTENERREIELEENLRRKDLTSYERAKTMVALVETARAVAQDEEVSFQVGTKPSGRPPEPGSARDVEERTGVPVATAARAQQQVETADAYPFMQSWKQYHVLEAREALEALPESERVEAVAIIDQPGVPPKHALEILHNLKTMTVPERQDIYRLRDSSDLRDQHDALTKAIQLPPSPDPRIIILASMIREVEHCIKLFPDDELTPRYRDIAVSLSDLQNDTTVQWRNRP